MGGRPWSCQARHQRQASFSTQLPSGTISPRLLGDGDEPRGGDRDAVALPAGQRFDRDDLPAGVAHRLEGDRQLLVLQGDAEVVLHLQPLDGRLVHGRLEGAVRATVLPLTVEQRGVGVAQQGVDVVTVVGVRRHPDAGRHRQRLAGDEIGLLERHQQAVRDDLDGTMGVDVVGNVGGDQGKLVGPDAAERVAGADADLEPLGDLLQDGVAVLVAQRVVEVLEPVEVDQEHRQLGAGPAGPLQGLVQPVVREHAVGQLGQRVEQRLARQPVGHLLAVDGQRQQLHAPTRQAVALLAPGADPRPGKHQERGGRLGADRVRPAGAQFTGDAAGVRPLQRPPGVGRHVTEAVGHPAALHDDGDPHGAMDARDGGGEVVDDFVDRAVGGDGVQRVALVGAEAVAGQRPRRQPAHPRARQRGRGRNDREDGIDRDRVEHTFVATTTGRRMFFIDTDGPGTEIPTLTWRYINRRRVR
jgi:hypothetical protein